MLCFIYFIHGVLAYLLYETSKIQPFYVKLGLIVFSSVSEILGMLVLNSQNGDQNSQVTLYGLISHICTSMLVEELNCLHLLSVTICKMVSIWILNYNPETKSDTLLIHLPTLLLLLTLKIYQLNRKNEIFRRQEIIDYFEQNSLSPNPKCSKELVNEFLQNESSKDLFKNRG